MAGKFALVLSLFCLLASACEDDPTIVDSCGDGIVDPGEQCDGSTGGQTCVSLGYYNTQGALSCSAGCEFVVSDCGGRCGDGAVDAEDGEQCDQTNLNGQTCQSRGFSGGPLGCDSTCIFNVSQCVSTCGNDIRETGETCDDGNTAPDDGCSGGCQTESGWECSQASPNVCSTICGDTIVAGDEVCDAEDLDGQTCLTLGYYGGALGCSESCALDQSACEAEGRCGDGLIQEAYGELCDGDELGGQTCATREFWAGPLACDACTTLDDSGCSRLVGITAATDFTCAVDSSGQAWCWGANDAGQLGNGTTTASLTPAAVTMPPGVRFTTITAGWNHVCALDLNQAAWCWGEGEEGKLGTGDLEDRPIPTAVVLPSPRTFTSISCGNDHTCAIDNQGDAWCWGDGGDGRLGNGTTTSRISPAAVTMPGSSPFIQISCGGEFTCALNLNHKTYCWGNNSHGQLGNGTTTRSLIPSLVTMGTDEYSTIGAGAMHGCAIRINSTRVFCWGNNWFGQLGDGTSDTRLVPTLTTSTSAYSSVFSGSRHTCARRSTGPVYCWGDGVQGQLGNGEETLYSTAQAVVMPVGVDFSFLSPGNSHTCALDTEGHAWCWGSGADGRTGLGSVTNTNVPTAVLPPPQ